MTPSEIVDRQWRAYNSRDIDTYCALFAADAQIVRLNDGQVIARGIESIRAHYVARFRSPNLHCRIESRMQLGSFVVDRERVEGITDAVLEVIAIYDVRDGFIRSL